MLQGMFTFSATESQPNSGALPLSIINLQRSTQPLSPLLHNWQAVMLHHVMLLNESAAIVLNQEHHLPIFDHNRC